MSGHQSADARGRVLPLRELRLGGANEIVDVRKLLKGGVQLFDVPGKGPVCSDTAIQTLRIPEKLQEDGSWLYRHRIQSNKLHPKALGKTHEGKSRNIPRMKYRRNVHPAEPQYASLREWPEGSYILPERDIGNHYLIYL